MARNLPPVYQATLPHNRFRYRHRSPKLRCRCGVCTADYIRFSEEYRNQVKNDVRLGRRAEPAWMRNERLRRQEKEHSLSDERANRRTAAHADAAAVLELLAQVLKDAGVIDQTSFEVVDGRQTYVDLRLNVRFSWEKVPG